MSDAHYLREAEWYETLLTQKSKHIVELQAEIERLKDGEARLRSALEVTTNDCKEAFASNEKLRAALEDIAYPNPVHGEDQLMNIARAALEGRT